MEQSQEIGELAKALSKAQAEIRDAEKARENPHLKSKYATLTAVWNACREPLTKNGLAVIQAPCASAEHGWLGMETLLTHESGQWIRSTFFMPVSKQDPQGFGSAITYARRYALSSVAGVCPDEDDDGNEGSSPRQETAPRNQRQPESRGDAAAAKNGNGVADWKTRCAAKVHQLFPTAKGNASLQLAIASSVIGKAIETFDGWEDNRHWRGYLEKLEKLSKPEVNKIISEAFAAVTSEPAAPAMGLDLADEDDPFTPEHPCQQEAPAMTRGA